MDLINEMLVAQNETVVGYHEFLQKFQLGDNRIHCFYEAKDDILYYHPIVRRLTGIEDCLSYKCRNKDGVLKVYGLVKAKIEYNLAKTGYFVDRDFDSLLNNPDVYETPFYSIENFYTQVATVQRIFIEQFEMPLDHPDYEKSLSLFGSVRAIFHEKVLSINAYLKCYSRIRHEKGNVRLNIDDKFNVKNGVSESLDDFTLNHIPQDVPSLEALFDTNGLISYEDFESEKKALRELDMGQVFRGKFEMQFLESFLKRFKNAVDRKNEHMLSKRYSCSTQFSYEQLFTQLGSYAYLPEDLRSYIFTISKKTVEGN